MPLSVNWSRRVPSLSPASKKPERYRDNVEAEMAQTSSMSESEIQAVIEEQARTKEEEIHEFLDRNRLT